MHNLNTPRLTFRLAFFAGVLAAASAVTAASECKGMQQDSCAQNAACTWVDGYTRKDGRQVASHCKLRSGKKSAAEASANTLQLTRAQ